MDNNRIILLLFLFLLVSCGSIKKQPKVVYRDSVITKIEYKDRVVHDTAKVEIPVEVEKVVTKDTVSHLENTYAKSDAVVSDGLLYHSLESKPKVIKVPYEVVVHDTLKVTESIKEEQAIKEIPAKLNWWQRFRMNAFWGLFGIVFIGLLWIFRKPLLSMFDFKL